MQNQKKKKTPILNNYSLKHKLTTKNHVQLIPSHHLDTPTRSKFYKKSSKNLTNAESKTDNTWQKLNPKASSKNTCPSNINKKTQQSKIYWFIAPPRKCNPLLTPFPASNHKSKIKTTTKLKNKQQRRKKKNGRCGNRNGGRCVRVKPLKHCTDH